MVTVAIVVAYYVDDNWFPQVYIKRKGIIPGEMTKTLSNSHRSLGHMRDNHDAHCHQTCI